ncbi:MAG TPA: AAA family ATPase [Gemmatales bacterium]|nr:AAA family ATPase [Gemmatales bacterium]
MSLRMLTSPVTKDLTPRSTTWLTPDLLPLGKIVTLDGPSGVGKTRFAAKLAAQATTGTLPGQTKLINVHWFVNFEHFFEHALAPLREFGADFDRFRHTTIVTNEQNVNQQLDFSSHEQAKLFMDMFIPKTPHLVIIDEPSQLHQSESTNINELKFFWQTLEILAESRGHCFLVLRRTGCHLTRTDRLLHQLGSQFAKINLTLAWHPHDRTQRLLTVAKNQLGPVGMQHAVTMDRIVTWTELADDDHAKPTHQASPITWNKKKPGPASQAHLIARELLTLLTEPKLSREIEEHFLSQGHSKNSIRTAIKQLGIKSYKEGSSWWLTLSKEPEEKKPEVRSQEPEERKETEAYQTATIATTSRLASQTLPIQVEEMADTEANNSTSSIVEVEPFVSSPDYSESEEDHEELMPTISASST